MTTRYTFPSVDILFVRYKQEMRTMEPYVGEKTAKNLSEMLGGASVGDVDIPVAAAWSDFLEQIAAKMSPMGTMLYDRRTNEITAKMSEALKKCATRARAE